jgi:hypothetical protein
LEEIKEVTRALRLVEKYEDYLFRRAFGKTLVVQGLVVPLGALLTFEAQPISAALGISIGAVIAIAVALIGIIGVGAVILLFASANIKASRKRGASQPGRAQHGVAIFFTWFFAWLIFFTLRPFAPPPFEVAPMLWAAGGSILITYLILRTSHAQMEFRDMPIVGLVLLAASVPIMLISDVTIATVVVILVFSACFVIEGFHAIVTAPKILKTDR